MKILGLDLSITSPGFCIMEIDSDYNILDISLHGFTSTNKWVYNGDKLKIHKMSDDYNKHPSHYRPHIIYSVLEKELDGIDYIAVEDYSYGSSGKVFDIAEWAGGLKNIFYTRKIPIKKFPPTTIKQCATGFGNADKVMMGKAFFQSKLFSMVDKHIINLPEFDNPQEDLIDACYLANVMRAELCYADKSKFPSELYMKESNCILAILTGKKNAKTKPSIEHPIIKFGEFYRIKKEKKVSKTKSKKNEENIAEVKTKIVKSKLKVDE